MKAAPGIREDADIGVFVDMKAALKALFRASFMCVVGDVSTEEETTNGKRMTSFTLMDDLGAWIPCIAMDDHMKSETLADNNKVFIYNGRARVGVGFL